MLDAHISGPRVGAELEKMGHDVRGVDQEKELEGLPDDMLFELAVSEGRILVSQNVKNFLQIVGRRAPERSHPGLILIPYPIRLGNFGAIIWRLQEMLSSISQQNWVDRVEWRKRGE